ncbi:glutathione S-transferase family protein [Ottowia sp.]|uniref:glutathione S-transferase family protein n=1 Tax=Ottowia sp. TaxID=1898956 RepID=UPI002B65D6FC|nr:glutathione S-transferase family protein [Pseudomonadota bacterium]HOV18211.1 glutathione S-transferase family protein [Ottowia sp.]
MIHLYHCVDARSFRPLWVLEEMRLPYELTVLPFPPRVLAPEYKKLNPLGTIPLLLDGATRMTESAAIGHYLATRHGPSLLAVDVAEDDYGAFLNWTHFGEATLTFPQTLVLRYSLLEPEAHRLPQVADAYAQWFLARLRAIEAALEGRDWLCAGRFTVADVSVGYALLLASFLKLHDQFGPNVTAYWQRLQQREGYQRARAAQQRAAEQAGLGPTFGSM